MGASKGDLAERLSRRTVVTPNGCHEWRGYADPKGYGRMRLSKAKVIQTHRLAWELERGPIPEGMSVLHHCDNPPCHNVEKCLFLGTTADNNTDKAMKGRSRNGRLGRTHCPQNHPYDEANTYITPDGGRDCRICRKDRHARFLARRKAAQLANSITEP